MKIPKSAKGQRLPNPDLQWQLTEEKSLDGRIHFKVFNRSPNSYLAFKIGTRSEHMSLFTVNPNPGLIKPSSGILIQISLAVSSQDSASLPKATAIFSIVSKQVPWESERHSIRDYRFTDQFCCQANVSEQSLKLIEKPDGFRIHSTPNKARPRPRRSLVGPPPPGNDSLCSPFNTSLSSINSYGSNSSDSTILDNVTLSEPLMPPPPTEISMAQTHRQSVFAPDETDDLSGQPSTVNTIVFGIIAALSHIFCFALYTGTSWEDLPHLGSAILSTLFNDPDPLSFDLAFEDVRVWISLTGHVFWIVATCLLLTALIVGKRFMVYPWFVMMIFSQLNTSTILIEMLGQDNSKKFEPFVLGMATIGLGLVTIYLVWRDLKRL